MIGENVETKLTRLLMDLGDTREAVAAFLEGQGIKNTATLQGSRASHCPIAQYLIRATALNIYVSADAILVWDVAGVCFEDALFPVPKAVVVPVPKAVADYIVWADQQPLVP